MAHRRNGRGNERPTCLLPRAAVTYQRKREGPIRSPPTQRCHSVFPFGPSHRAAVLNGCGRRAGSRVIFGHHPRLLSMFSCEEWSILEAIYFTYMPSPPPAFFVLAEDCVLLRFCSRRRIRRPASCFPGLLFPLGRRLPAANNAQRSLAQLPKWRFWSVDVLNRLAIGQIDVLVRLNLCRKKGNADLCPVTRSLRYRVMLPRMRAVRTDGLPPAAGPSGGGGLLRAQSHTTPHVGPHRTPTAINSRVGDSVTTQGEDKIWPVLPSCQRFQHPPMSLIRCCSYRHKARTKSVRQSRPISVHHSRPPSTQESVVSTASGRSFYHRGTTSLSALQNFPGLCSFWRDLWRRLSTLALQLFLASSTSSRPRGRTSCSFMRVIERQGTCWLSS